MVTAKKLIQSREFGKPNTELWWAFRILEQLNTVPKLQVKTAWAFLSRVIFSSICKNEAVKPIAPVIVIIPYNNFCLVSCFMNSIITRRSTVRQVWDEVT